MKTTCQWERANAIQTGAYGATVACIADRRGIACASRLLAKLLVGPIHRSSSTFKGPELATSVEWAFKLANSECVYSFDRIELNVK